MGLLPGGSRAAPGSPLLQRGSLLQWQALLLTPKRATGRSDAEINLATVQQHYIMLRPAGWSQVYKKKNSSARGCRAYAAAGAPSLRGSLTACSVSLSASRYTACMAAPDVEQDRERPEDVMAEALAGCRQPTEPAEGQRGS